MKTYSQALKILKENKIKIDNENINSSESFNRVSSVNIYTKEKDMKKAKEIISK